MRVLFFNPVATLGGAERVLLQCLEQLRTIAEIEPSLLTLENGPLLQEAEFLGVPGTAVPAPAGLAEWGDSQSCSRDRISRVSGFARRGLTLAPSLLLYIRRLRLIVRRLRPDVIHSNGIKTHLLGFLVGPTHVPVIWHVHDFYSMRPFAAGLLRVARRGVRRAIAISGAVAADVRRTIPGLHTTTIRNTVDCARFAPGPGDGAALDRLAGVPALPAHGFRVGLVAAYARWKGHRAFLEAAAQVIHQHDGPPTRWYIVGGPIYRTSAQYSLDELRDCARQLGIAEHVAFVPFQTNPADVYRALDLVVHASQQAEPFGLTIAEAMACGRPVIVSRAGGAAELFDPDVEAVGVPPGDIAALARAIINLRADERLRIKLGQAARVRAERDFQPARLGPQLAEVYRSCFPRSRLWEGPGLLR